MKCQSDGDFEAQSEGSYEYLFQVEVEACSLKQGLRSSGDVVRHVRAQVRRGSEQRRRRAARSRPGATRPSRSQSGLYVAGYALTSVRLLDIRNTAVELTERLARLPVIGLNHAVIGHLRPAWGSHP
jgi:hypothetical protein